MKLFDISPVVSTETPVWPGDTRFQVGRVCKLEDGDSVNLSWIKSTLHLGAHTDAPNHFQAGASGIDEVDLVPYIGPCVVVEVSKKDLIEVSDCKYAVEQGATRILFRTWDLPENPFEESSFCAFSKEAVTFMGENGVVLIGIDTPSIDPFESKDLPAHQELGRFQMRNLEGLDLTHVKSGNFELIALPLKLKGCDASPVRALLRSI